MFLSQFAIFYDKKHAIIVPRGDIVKMGLVD